MPVRLAIDIGGTFTDLAAYETDTGELLFTKTSTTPDELTDAIFACVDKLSLVVSAVDLFIHGSTVGINTIIERKGPATALITTKGFRDVYEMGRRNRPDIYDLLFHRPRPLVPRDLCFEVVERLDATGQVLTPLDQADMSATLAAVAEAGVETVAVCLLHSYANPEHEQRLGAEIAKALPDVSVSLSSDIHREYREYERTSTTVINAYLRPVVGGYLNRLQACLDSREFAGRTLIMQSSGGVMALDAAARQPVRIIESGPAGGVAGAQWLCSSLGYSNAIAFDMGGTTAKACLIEDGQAKVTSNYYVGGRVSGHPAQVPFLDIIEIGTGGGSIAAVDAVGALKVGPQSAGADPGPACYGGGGVEATITDANLLVGKLDPEQFLGGEMRLDPGLAEQAIARLAGALDLPPQQTANGILRIANAQMARAISKVTVERGKDPRDFTMVAYGGAGPMHATAVARELGIRHVVIPRAPGQFSALGMLTTDIRYDYAQTHPTATAALTAADIDGLFAALEDAARAQLAADMPSSTAQFVRSADMRYLGQFHTLTIAMPDEADDDQFVHRLNARFHEAHAAAYGHAAPSEATELLSLRLAALVPMSKPEFPTIAEGDADASAALIGRRQVMWEDGSETHCEVYRREDLRASNRIIGPAIIQEAASITPVARDEVVTVDRYGHLHIDVSGGTP